MEIRFIKQTNTKGTISCTRRDGTVTWMQINEFFIHHDLMHYAVETTLRYRHAFYGMLANGVNISDFELPKEQRPFNLTEQALNTESIVNLALIDYFQGVAGNFNAALQDVYEKNAYEHKPPVITEEQVMQIKSDFRALVHQWKAIPEGQQLYLSFSE